MAFITSLLLGFLPIFMFAGFVYWLDRYEKEPLILLGAVFTWGAVVAAACAFVINTVFGLAIFAFTGSQTAADMTTGSLSAPIVEEILKGAAVFLVFLVFHSEFDSVLDGVIYASMCALGFAATENAFYIYSLGYQANGWLGLFSMAFVRIVLVGWQHPFYTSFFGIGLAVARMNRSKAVQAALIFLGLGAAIFTHSFHNTLTGMFTSIGGIALGTFVDWSGWIIMFLFIIGMIYREKRYIRIYLLEEVQMGTITPAQYKAAYSARAQMRKRFSLLGKKYYGVTTRFYQLCAELSHKKHQYDTLGEEDGNYMRIQELRDEIRQLSAFAQ
jgi:protease PrsW